MMNSITISIISLILFYWCSLGGGTLLNRTVRQTFCNNDQYQCSDGKCISKSDVCNGWSHCNDGSDEAPKACECGTGTATGHLASKPPGAHEAPSGAQPWHVGIYRVRHNNHHTLICSGALLYDDIVVTSANCVIDPDSHLTYSTASIRISAGKLKRDYNVDESFQQKMEVKKIIKRDRYEGDTKGYLRNLAIIKLKQKVNKSNFLGPVCLWTNPTFPAGARRGIISGWGLQSVGNYAVNLRESLVNMMDVGDCVRRFYDPLFKRFLTNDKFCMTFDQGVGLKDDDTGGPVTVLHEGRFYLVGVVSVQLPNSEFGIATKISKHFDWIKKTVYELKESDNCLQGSHFNCNSNSKCIKMEAVCDNKKDCVDGSDEDPSLCSTKPPPGNESGVRCEIPEGSELFTAVKCGDLSGCKSKFSAPSNSKYQITCPAGRGFAKLNTQVMSAVCQDGEWVPDLKESKCLKLCPPQEYKSLELECLYRGSHVSCNEMMRPDTKVIVSCKKQFKKQILVNYVNQTKCRTDGLFYHDISAECTPVCGVPYDNQAQILLSQGRKTKYAKYPWHVGLYWKTLNEDGEMEFKYQCGGTLIDTNKVLTAGHCVWEAGKNDLIEPSNLAVAFGKYYSSWHRKEDLEQKIAVYKIIPGKHYNGAKTKHSQDIAILILTKDVTMSDYTMPACLDLNGTSGGIPKNQLGHIVGWGRLSETDTEPSPELMETYMEYLDLDTCRKRYDRYGFSEYLQTDKFCVIYQNGSGTQMGDSGGGLTFTHQSLHYVYGVVSIKKRGQDEFAAFTNVLSHGSWIYDILQNY